jgi:hypothetical protein
MAKTILIPIDFSVASLNTLKLALERGTNKTYNVVLLYAVLPSDSITELLFYSKDEIINARITTDFIEALEVIKNRFEKKLNDVSILPFHGSNLNALENLLHANRVDEIFIPGSYKLQLAKRAFDPIPMLKEAAVPVSEIHWNQQPLFNENNHLKALFNWAKN